MSSSKYNPGYRLRFLIIGGVVLFGFLGARLADLQIVRNTHFEAVAEAQRKRASELAPSRGTIYVTEGQAGELFPVASNKKAWIAYAVPRDMKDPENVVDQLVPALVAYRERQWARVQEIIQQTGQAWQLNPEDQDPVRDPVPDGLASRNGGTVSNGAGSDEQDRVSDEPGAEETKIRLLEKFNRRSDPYEPFLRPHEVLDDELKDFLEEHQLPGIVLEEQQVRIYPEGQLAAHVLGYVGFEDERRVGRYGIEGYFEEQLGGDLGWLSTERDTAGRFIGVGASEFRPAQDGADIVLTVDRVVQSFVEQEIEDGVRRYGAVRGSIIVMNPKTGAVLGMATYPTFDPNIYYAVRDARVQLNPVVSDIFEPGSILKPIIMASAINDDIVQPSTTFVDSGPVRVAEYTIDTYDGKHYGVQTMTQVLEQSNNVGMVWVAQQVGAQTLYDYLRRFGLGERTGIKLDGETQTNMAEPGDWNIATVATVGFGQGVALTPLQALNAVNAIANEGTLMQPYIVSHIRHSDGRVEESEPKPVRSVVSQQTAEKVSAMMVSVIENGVAHLARIPGYYLAGKTGTAQVPDERGGYSKEDKIISFIGFGPVEDPRFSVLIKLDNPAGLSFASGTTAPMFRNLAEKLLNYYQIPPSYDDSVKQPEYQVPE